MTEEKQIEDLRDQIVDLYNLVSCRGAGKVFRFSMVLTPSLPHDCRSLSLCHDAVFSFTGTPAIMVA